MALQRQGVADSEGLMGAMFTLKYALGPVRDGKGFTMPVKQRGFIRQAGKPFLSRRRVALAYTVPAVFMFLTFLKV